MVESNQPETFRQAQGEGRTREQAVAIPIRNRGGSTKASVAPALQAECAEESAHYTERSDWGLRREGSRETVPILWYSTDCITALTVLASQKWRVNLPKR